MYECRSQVFEISSIDNYGFVLKFWVRDSVIDVLNRYGLKSPESNPGGSEIFRTLPARPWDPTSLLYSGYRVFPGGKAAGAWG
jgi:hypothetical protein